MNRILSLANGRRALRTAGALALLGVASTAFGADHRDGDNVKLKANIAADINDVFAFKTTDKLVLGMTVFPQADANAAFDTAAVYALHVDKYPAFLDPDGSAGSAEVLCTFSGEGNISCWVTDSSGTLDYVTGDASAEAGLESENGRFKVFAGLRTDPFYFNLDGFNAARTAVFNAFSLLTFNGNGCPIIDGITANGLRTALVATAQNQDFFRELDTLGIVIEADPTLFTDADNQVVGVYASTHTQN